MSAGYSDRATAWLIDTQFSRPTLVEATLGTSLDAFSTAIGGYVEELYLPDTRWMGFPDTDGIRLSVLVDEEARLKGVAPPNYRATCLAPSGLLGPVLIAATKALDFGENGHEDYWVDVTEVLHDESGVDQLLLMYAVHHLEARR